MLFKDLGLSAPLLSAIQKVGYETPTPIQAKAIPIVLESRDIFGCAQTGTGKTAAFALPLLELMSQHASSSPQRQIKVLVLAPTRELASQIQECFVQYGKQLPFRSALLIGGVSMSNQINKLKQGVEIIVATPGRLVDLLNQRALRLDKVEHLVLDEADRMLDMGFIRDIRRILAQIPTQRQTLFFSATAPAEIMKLAREILHDPIQVNVSPVSSTSTLVKQHLYYVRKENKRKLLSHVLKQENIEHALIFTRTKRGADRLVKELNKTGINSEAIHGNKSQNARDRSLKAFKSRQISFLVATDLAARGIDVDQLSHVINFELPDQAETYVHRIGRTGRGGASGIAISFCSLEEKDTLKDIHKLIKTPIPVVDKHPYLN